MAALIDNSLTRVLAVKNGGALLKRGSNELEAKGEGLPLSLLD